MEERVREGGREGEEGRRRGREGGREGRRGGREEDAEERIRKIYCPTNVSDRIVTCPGTLFIVKRENCW